MRTSLRLYRCVALVAVTLMISTVAVRAQSGISTAGGVVADERATRQGKFVVVTGAKVELQHVTSRESKFSASTDDRGVYSFGRIPYGNYVLTVSAPGYRPYGLNFFVDSDGSAFIAVLLSKQ
jgi:Carboxypeptidase regulatory-like domain